MDEFKKLKEWLKDDNNTKTYLAYRLGYKSSLVLDQWLARGRIPQREIARAMDVIKKPQPKDGDK